MVCHLRVVGTCRGTVPRFTRPVSDSCASVKENANQFPLYLADALILMSTPAGKLNLFNASIVLAVACTISITRL